MEAPCLHSWFYTVFVATASTFNPCTITHSSVNCGARNATQNVYNVCNDLKFV